MYTSYGLKLRNFSSWKIALSYYSCRDFSQRLRAVENVFSVRGRKKDGRSPHFLSLRLECKIGVYQYDNLK